MKRRGFIATLLGGTIAAVLPKKADSEKKKDRPWRGYIKENGVYYSWDDDGKIIISHDGFNWRKSSGVKNADIPEDVICALPGITVHND